MARLTPHLLATGVAGALGDPAGVPKPGAEGTPSFSLRPSSSFSVVARRLALPRVFEPCPRACPPSPFAPLLPSTAPPFLEEEMQAWRGRATGPGRSQEGARPRCTPAPQPPFPRVCGRGSPSRCGAPLLHLVASWPPNWHLPPETEGSLTWPCTAPSAGGKEGLRGGSLGPFLWDRAGRGLWPCCLWVVPISWYYQGASGCQEVCPAPSPETSSRAEPSAPSASHPGARRRLQDSPSLSVACVCPA